MSATGWERTARRLLCQVMDTSSSGESQHSPTRRTSRATAVLALLSACAGTSEHQRCPDITGTYAEHADGASERLSALVLPEGSSRTRSQVVTLALATDQDQMTVKGERDISRTLKRNQDFVCDDKGLRLSAPRERGLDLGEMLVHRVETFYTFSKAPDGTLVASQTTLEHAKIGGIPLTGKERQVRLLRWRPAPS